MWFYRTDSGVFQIAENPDRPGVYLLSFDGVHLGEYDSPEGAAKDVFIQNTGWDEWDSLLDVSPPPDLSSWGEGPLGEVG
jgi:hypothetical protein